MSRKRTERDYSFVEKVLEITEFIAEHNVGSHIQKGRGGMSGVLEALKTFAKNQPGMPCQMFMRNPRGFSTVHPDFLASGSSEGAPASQPFHITVKPDGVDHIRAFVKDNLPFYVHAPYTINLCANATKEIDARPVEWAQAVLNEDMHHARLMGSKGLVVHTGSLVGRPLEEGLKMMEQMVKKTIRFASRESKLLLETPSGEGAKGSKDESAKGVCATLFDFIEFFQRFSAKEQKRMGVCVDTCHVFAAGEDPLEYLQMWHSLRGSESFPGGSSAKSENITIPAIELVHLNDSTHPFGSRVDDHAPIGMGCIGMEKLELIAKWCTSNNIPTVKEWNVSL